MAMTFTYDDGKDAFGVGGMVRTVIASWTSDSSGNASGTTQKLSGRIIKGVTVPSGTAAPTDNYDITLTDAQSVNILGGCDDDLIDRDTANTEEVYFLEKDHQGTPTTQSIHPAVNGPVTVTVANAGNVKSGTLYLYLLR